MALQVSVIFIPLLLCTGILFFPELIWHFFFCWEQCILPAFCDTFCSMARKRKRDVVTHADSTSPSKRRVTLTTRARNVQLTPNLDRRSSNNDSVPQNTDNPPPTDSGISFPGVESPEVSQQDVNGQHSSAADNYDRARGVIEIAGSSSGGNASGSAAAPATMSNQDFRTLLDLINEAATTVKSVRSTVATLRDDFKRHVDRCSSAQVEHQGDNQSRISPPRVASSNEAGEAGQEVPLIPPVNPSNEGTANTLDPVDSISDAHVDLAADSAPRRANPSLESQAVNNDQTQNVNHNAVTEPSLIQPTVSQPNSMPSLNIPISDVNLNRPSFISGLKCGASVDHKLVEDIWSGAYVDLSLLLRPDSNPRYDLALEANDGMGSLTFTQRPRRVIHNIHQWAKAFEIFMAVLLRKPGGNVRAEDLLTYYQFIKKLSDEHLDWKAYDENYRRDRAYHSNPAPWGTIRHDLYTEAIARRTSIAFRSNLNNARPNQSNQSSHSAASRTPRVPKSFCYSFHSPTLHCDKGQSCPYKHLCPVCFKGPHPAYNCRNKPAAKEDKNEKNDKSDSSRGPNGQDKSSK